VKKKGIHSRLFSSLFCLLWPFCFLLVSCLLGYLFWEPGTTLKELFNKRGALIILCSIIPSYLLFMFIGFIYGSIAGKNIGEPYME